MGPRTVTAVRSNAPVTAPSPSMRRQAAVDIRANLLLLAIVAAAILLQFLIWPVMLQHWGWAALPLALPLVILAPTQWGLIHEAIHGQLLPRRLLNEATGRALAIAYLLPFEAVRFGHLMHHRFTREPYDRPDVYDGPRHRLRAHMTYYLRLLGGLYAAELAAPLLAFMPSPLACRLVAREIGSAGAEGPSIQRLFVGFAGDPARRRRMRRDWLLSLVLHGLAFHLYGAWWPALAMTMYLRGVWLSMADNLPHYDVALDEPERARNFRVPRVWQPVLMNHHLHQWHHRYPTLPWTALPAIARENGTASAGIVQAPYFRSALRQFRRLGGMT